MTDWPVKTLDALCDEGIVLLGRGNVISRKDIAANPGPYPIYSSARENEGKFGEYGAYMFDEEMITWSIDGGGRLFYRPKHKFSVTNVGGTLRVLKPEVLEIRYLHRALENLHSRKVFDWVFKAHPSVIRKVYDEIPVPPLEEQNRIVDLLDAATARITELTACYEQARALANNLFESLYASCFEHQGAETVLGDIADLNGGYAFKSSDYTESGVFVLRTLNIDPNGNITKRRATYVSKTRMEEFDRFKLLENDILFVMVGATLGKTGVVREGDLPALLNQNMWVIRAKSDLIDPQYLYFVFMRYSKSLLSGAAGAARAFVKRDDFRNLMVPVPSLEEQKKIVARLDSMREKTSEMVAAYGAKLTAAKNLRQSILEAAFAGEL